MWFFLTLPLIAVAVLLVVGWLTNASQAPAATGTPRQTATFRAFEELGATLHEGVYELVEADRAFRLSGRDHDKQGPQTLFIATDVSSTRARERGSAFRDAPQRDPLAVLPGVIFRRERPTDRRGKSLGLNAEIQTGDRAFDDAVYIEHDGDRAAVSDLVGRVEVRAAIAAAVDEATNLALQHEGNALELHWARTHAPIDDAAMRSAVQRLAAVAEALPPIRDASARPRKSPYVGLFSTMFVMISPLGGFALRIFARDVEPLDASFYAIAWIVVALVLAVVLVRAWKRARGLARGLARLYWTTITALLLVPPFVAPALAFANAWGVDDARTVEVTDVVVDDSWSKKGGRSCWVRLRPGDGFGEKARLDCAVFDASPRRDEAWLQVGQGRFGWEWVDHAVLAPPTR